jgi:hypothetical protein
MFTTIASARNIAVGTQLTRNEAAMARYIWLAFTNPIDGQDAAFNRWYNDEHMPDVLGIDVISAAQRFEFAGSSGGPEPYQRYLAIYEIEAASPEEAMAAVNKARAEPGRMRATKTLDPNILQWYFRPMGPRVTLDQPSDRD